MGLTGAWAHPEIAVASQTTSPRSEPLLTFASSDDHGEDAGRFFLLVLLALGALAGTRSIDDQVSQSGVVEDTGRGIADVEKDLIKGAMRKIVVNQFAQLFGVAEGGERAVNQADNLAQLDVGRVAAQLVAALGPANALDHAGVLQFQENQFQEFFREHLFIGDIADPNGALVMMAGEHHHGLEGVESFLGDLHRLTTPLTRLD